MTATDLDELIRRVEETLRAVPGFERITPPSTTHLADATMPVVDQPLARLIDHTLLKADATPAQIEQLCREAVQYGFAAVCVNPAYVPLCRQVLAESGGSDSAICTVVGFPLGATTTATRVFETRQAIEAGAREIDMVMAIGRLKAGDYAAVRDDMAQVIAASHAAGALCKVIIETALLSDAEKVAACLLAAGAQADFVKTSTGFSSGGATVADVTLMRHVVGHAIGVKAAGGVRTLAAAQAMLAAGATRIGTSAGVHLLCEASDVPDDQPSLPDSY